MKKIDVYYNNEYICTTTQSKTCKDAKIKFLENPKYQSVGGEVKINGANENNIKCKFAK